MWRSHKEQAGCAPHQELGLRQRCVHRAAASPQQQGRPRSARARGAYTDTYTYTTPGTYTINATFQGSPTTLAAGSPGAGGISGDYLLPCGPARAPGPPRPAAMAGALARPRPADSEPTGWACIIRPHQARRACLCADVSLSELSPRADFRSPRLACS